MQGFLRKMSSQVPDGGCSPDKPVQYFLKLDEAEHPLNQYLGESISLNWTGKIACLHCGRASRKSYSQGYCYPCFKKLAQCDLCIVSPERCHFAAGTCRDESFAERFCMQPHIVYIANSSGLKVGITKQENLPTRWIDQGAVQALPILSVQTRQQSGFVEEAFKQHVSDKTRWQQMLSSEDSYVDLEHERDELLPRVAKDLDNIVNLFGAIESIQAEVQTLTYPVLQYPTKVTSLSFDKTDNISGRLMGIKGQYLILDTGVLNLRRFTSYEITFSVGVHSNDEPTGQLSLL